MGKPSALRSPSVDSRTGDQEPWCKTCLLEGRITRYTSPTWHRLWRCHWPRNAEAHTDDEALLRKVELDGWSRRRQATQRWQRRVERVMGWLRV